MCAVMANIQTATADIRRGKENIAETTGQKNIMSASATQGGHKKKKKKRKLETTGVKYNGLPITKGRGGHKMVYQVLNRNT